MEPSAAPSDVQLAVRDVAVRSGACVAMGFSAGATLLLNVAVRWPDLFDTRVCLGIGDRAFATDPAILRTRASMLLASDVEPDGWMRAITRSAARNGLALPRVAAFLASALTAPPLESLTGVPGRSLFVVGADDLSGPLDGLARSIPSARVRVIPRCDHFRLPAEPAAMSEVLAFLRETPGEPGRAGASSSAND